MARHLISSGSRYEEMAGYSRAVVDGDWIFVSGTSGHDHATGRLAADAAAQTAQSLRTISAALAEAGAGLEDVVRLRVFLSDRADVEPVCAVLRKTFEHIRPANTTMICAFAEEDMKVELEVTALRRRGG